MHQFQQRDQYGETRHVAQLSTLTCPSSFVFFVPSDMWKRLHFSVS